MGVQMTPVTNSRRPQLSIHGLRLTAIQPTVEEALLFDGAFNIHKEIFVVTEGDLSYGDDIVGRLSTHLIEGDYDCVVASPHTSGGGMKNVPVDRAFFTRAGNWILMKLMPVKLGTYTGMTRAYKREMIQAIDLESNGKELHLEIISKLAALDYQIGELPAMLQWPA
jgi:dolichol-phosphate mannosyltransferase